MSWAVKRETLPCRAPLERCRAPGAMRMQLPFVCPLDHVLQLAHLDDDPATYGTPISYREHSFLDNPATPDHLKVTAAPLQAAPPVCIICAGRGLDLETQACRGSLCLSPLHAWISAHNLGLSCTQTGHVELTTADAGDKRHAQLMDGQLIVPRDLSEAELRQLVEPHQQIEVSAPRISMQAFNAYME